MGYGGANSKFGCFYSTLQSEYVPQMEHNYFVGLPGSDRRAEDLRTNKNENAYGVTNLPAFHPLLRICKIDSVRSCGIDVMHSVCDILRSLSTQNFIYSGRSL